MLLMNINRMHTEQLLNPFYQADYVLDDDGQDFDVFTQLQDYEEKKLKTSTNEIDAVEDLILDDFSFGDSDSEDEKQQKNGEPFEAAGEHKSSQSSADDLFGSGKPRSKSMIDGAFRQRGKQILTSHTYECLQTFTIKIDQLVL